MPVFLPVGLPGYIDNPYDPFARMKRLPCRPSSARVKRKVRISVPKTKDQGDGEEKEVKNKSKDDLDLDYHGISNMMRGITFKTNRKWRLKNPDNDIDRNISDRKRGRPMKAWGNESIAKDGEIQSEKTDKVDYNMLRRSRSSSFIKYKYPKEYHHGLHNQQTVLEEKIPQCMRHYPKYTNLPVKQDCCYDSCGSVTQLKVHSVKSGSLPHPQVLNIKPRRPMSAPPSYSLSTSYSLQRGSLQLRKQPAVTQNGSTQERNGVFHVSHQEKSLLSHVEITSIDEESHLDTHSLPVNFDGDMPRQVFMKADDSDNEDGTVSPIPEHTVVSVEDVEDEEEDKAERRLSIEDRYGNPTTVDNVYEVKTDSANESIPDEIEDKRKSKKVKKKVEKRTESDAEEVESDY